MILKTSLVVGGALLVGLVLGEVVIRVVPRSWVPELGEHIEPKRVDLGATMQRSANPLLYYEWRPGVNEVNADGYRGPRYRAEKPRGTKRIVGIGDSTMEGSGLSEKDGYLRRLEAKLNEEGVPVQVVNLAVGGYNTHQELEMLRARGLAFDPDLVILGYDHNDPKPILGRVPPPLPEDYGRNPLRSELIRYVMRKIYLTPRLRIRNTVDGIYTSRGGYGWDEHVAALTDMAGLCRERGIPLLVVLYDSIIRRQDKRKDRHYRLLHEPLNEVWDATGVHLVDCYDLFQAWMREHDQDDMTSLWVSIEPRDGHPNPEGHRLIAEAIHEVIRRSDLLALDVAGDS